MNQAYVRMLYSRSMICIICFLVYANFMTNTFFLTFLLIFLLISFLSPVVVISTALFASSFILTSPLAFVYSCRLLSSFLTSWAALSLKFWAVRPNEAYPFHHYYYDNYDNDNDNDNDDDDDDDDNDDDDDDDDDNNNDDNDIDDDDDNKNSDAIL